MDPPDPWTGARHRLDPYIGCAYLCQYCYGLPEETLPDGRGANFTVRIGIKTNAVALLQKEEIAGPVWVGSHTDPYQPPEREHRLTRACLAALAGRRARVILMTRSEAALEDLDLLQAVSRLAGLCLAVSLPTAEPEATEPLAPSLRERFKLLRQAAKADLAVGAALAPLFPYRTRPEKIRPLLKKAREEGARFVLLGGLFLRGGMRMRFLGRVAAVWPETLGRYRLLFPTDGRLPELFEKTLAEPILQICRDLGLALGGPFADETSGGDRPILWQPA